MAEMLEDVNDLIDQSGRNDSKTFLGLIRCVIALLKKGQGASGTTRVYGRLIALRPSGKATIIGDLHGDLKSLTYILKDSGFFERARKGENVYLIFLGDYGDRGPASPEVYYVVLRLKELFPDMVILMRGNHEGPDDLLPIPHDLPAQLTLKYGEDEGAKIYTELRKLFSNLYSAVLIDEKYLLIHGGVPSNASAQKDLAYACKKHPKESYLEEMLWSDPEEGLEGVRPSPRGAGKHFGVSITERLLKLLNVKVLIRGHESCQEGFEIN
ncbi:MAG: metallophosphoesterase family protein, partial [Candidatus Bathyarchaeota archaeon]